ncbi:MAG TPA: hypothetical protein VHQ24_10075 [Lachnospiraceae bacterium]|nr:hypothetical protein [Lachnospiraceae bacterium]
MEELYQAIESIIKSSGYLGEIDGYTIYSEISDFIEDKDNGTYIYLSKNHNDDIFEYKVDVMDENFNLSYLNITSNGKKYHIDFDA